MQRIITLFAISWLAQPAFAGPNWQVTAFATDPQNASKVVAITDALMASPVGKQMPGTVSLMLNVAAGPGPSTHSFITSFESRAEREAFFEKLTADPAWSKFQKGFTSISERAGVTRLSFLESWGETAAGDVFWELYALEVSDADAYVAALDSFLASETGKDFPGSVYLSRVDAAGPSPSTHVVSVGYESEAEAETWGDAAAATKDWKRFMKDVRKASKPTGTWYLRTLKTWGTPQEQE